MLFFFSFSFFFFFVTGGRIVKQVFVVMHMLDQDVHNGTYDERLLLKTNKTNGLKNMR